MKIIKTEQAVNFGDGCGHLLRRITPAVLADSDIRKHVVEFFETLPLALTREDIRLAHAC